MAFTTRIQRSKNLILAAADAAFRAHGIAGTTMEDIAGRAGLTRKTVYNLFKSKDDIAQHLIFRAEANVAGYHSRIAANENVIVLLNRILLDSARWCLSNPALAALALNPAIRPSMQPPADRPSFQGIVRDAVLLGQQQRLIRSDQSPDFLALILLAVFGQAMLSALANGHFEESEIRAILLITIEGIGTH